MSRDLTKSEKLEVILLFLLEKGLSKKQIDVVCSVFSGLKINEFCLNDYSPVIDRSFDEMEGIGLIEKYYRSKKANYDVTIHGKQILIKCGGLLDGQK